MGIFLRIVKLKPIQAPRSRTARDTAPPVPGGAPLHRMLLGSPHRLRPIQPGLGARRPQAVAAAGGMLNGSTPHNHYEMTRPFGQSTPEPILFVSFKPCPEAITRAFRAVKAFPPVRVPLVRDDARLVYTCRLAGFEGMEDPR